jgi:hypothetical protein
MSDIALYRKTVLEWKRKYGIPKQTFDLSRTSTIRYCERCKNSTRKITRHHKGDDYFYAIMLPDDFAPRYIQFLREDIVFLCSTCHNNAHKILDEIRLEFKQELLSLMFAWAKKNNVEVTQENAYNIKMTHIVTRELCEKYIQLSRTATEKYVNSYRSRVRTSGTKEQRPVSRNSVDLTNIKVVREKSNRNTKNHDRD